MATFNLFIGDGAQSDFVYTFTILGSFSSTIVKTQKVDEIAFVTRVEGVDYTHSQATSTISFFSGFIPEDGEIVRLERFTTRDRLVDLEPGSTVKSQTLDNDANRLTAVTQEIESGVTGALRRNSAGTHWNGEAIPSDNCGEADSTDGWATLGQVQALVADVQIAELNEPNVLTFNGDGITTQFTLTGSVGLKTAMPSIYINGIIQRSDSGDYQILNVDDTNFPTFGDRNDVLDFAIAPPDGSEIHVRVFTGQVLGVLPEAFINDVDQISNDIITLQHIKMSAGAAGRLMFFDANGQPSLNTPGLSDLINSTQVLQAASRTAMQDATLGLSLDGFNRTPLLPIIIGGVRLKNVGMPETSTDGVNKSYVDGLITSALQAKIGSVATADLPLAPNSTVSIQDIGFPPDIFLMQFMVASSPWGGFGLWIRGGPNSKKFTMVGRIGIEANASFYTSYLSVFEVSASGSNMQIANRHQGHDSGSGGDFIGNPTMTDLLWFALKA